MSWFGASRRWQRRPNNFTEASRNRHNHDGQTIWRETSDRSPALEFPPSQRQSPFDRSRRSPAAPAQPHLESAAGPSSWRAINAPRSSHHPNEATEAREEEEDHDSLRAKRRKLLSMDDWTGAKLRKPLDIQFSPAAGDAPVWGWGQTQDTRPAQESCSSRSGLGSSPMRNSIWRDSRGPGRPSPARAPPSQATSRMASTTSLPRATAASVHWNGLSEDERRSLETDGLAIVSPYSGVSVPTTPAARDAYQGSPEDMDTDATSQIRAVSTDKGPTDVSSGAVHVPRDNAVPETPQSLVVDDCEHDIATGNMPGKKARPEQETASSTFPMKRLDIRSIPDRTDDPIEDSSSDQERKRVKKTKHRRFRKR